MTRQFKALIAMLFSLQSACLASSIRYSVQHLQAVYGADLTISRLGKDGTMSGGSRNGNSAENHLVVIRSGVRNDLPPTTGIALSSSFNAQGNANVVRSPGGTLAGIGLLNESGLVTALPYTPQGTSLTLRDSNRIGTVVGSETPLPLSGGRYRTGGFIYDPVNGGRTVRQLGGVDVTSFHSVNDAGYLVGYGLTQDTRQGYLFLWREGEAAIPLVKNIGGIADAINEAGQVVGIANDTAFFWDRGTLTSPVHKLVEDPAHPGTFNDAVSFSEGTDVSESGMMVGIAEFRSVPGSTIPAFANRGYLWTAEGGLIWLDDVIDPALGYTITGAMSIADNGQILATGFLAGSSVQQNFLLSLIPEPSVGAFLLVGMALLSRRRR